MPPFPWTVFIFWSMVVSVPWRWNKRVKICFAFLKLNFTKYKEDTDLWEVALLVNERQHVHWFAGQHVQGALVVLVVDVLPNNVFTSILILLQLENVLDEELLELLVGEVDAQLLEAATVQWNKWKDKMGGFQSVWYKNSSSGPLMSCAPPWNTNLFLLKFSKPKMSSKPIDCLTSSESSDVL